MSALNAEDAESSGALAADVVVTAGGGGRGSDGGDGSLDLQELRDRYYKATAKTSDISRQLALAGVAFIWIFSGGNVVTTSSGHLVVTNDLLASGLCFVIALGLDLVQYTYRSLAFGIKQWRREIKEQGDLSQVGKSFLLPRWINYVTLLCFWIKVAAVVTGYVFLGFGIANKIH